MHDAVTVQWFLFGVGLATAIAIFWQARETRRSAEAASRSIALQETAHE